MGSNFNLFDVENGDYPGAETWNMSWLLFIIMIRRNVKLQYKLEYW